MTMETLSNSTVEPLLDWTPACPVLISKAVAVGAMTWVPLTDRERVTGPDPVTWNWRVFQTPAVMVALPVATVVKVPVPLLL